MLASQSSAIAKITNAEVISEYFGYWPSFHDAEITKVTLEAHPGYWPSATFFIKAFEMTKEIDEKGYYKHIKQCVIELQFTEIREMELDFFNHQNVILNLAFEESDNFIKCTFDASVGLDAVVIAEKVVVSLTPTNAVKSST